MSVILTTWELPEIIFFFSVNTTVEQTLFCPVVRRFQFDDPTIMLLSQSPPIPLNLPLLVKFTFTCIRKPEYDLSGEI